jgi:hypothetical protein
MCQRRISKRHWKYNGPNGVVASVSVASASGKSQVMSLSFYNSRQAGRLWPCLALLRHQPDVIEGVMEMWRKQQRFQARQMGGGEA